MLACLTFGKNEIDAYIHTHPCYETVPLEKFSILRWYAVIVNHVTNI